MITYFMKLSARVKCAWCLNRVIVEYNQEIDVADAQTDEAGGIIEDSILEAMEAAGWHDGNCPDCMFKHGKEIQEQRDADS